VFSFKSIKGYFARTDASAILKQKLFRGEVKLSLAVLILLIVLVLGVSIFAPLTINKIQCQDAIDASEASINQAVDLDNEARERWGSFVDAQDEFFPNAKKEFATSRQFYFSYKSFWDQEYKNDISREFSISDQIILNNPTCFDPRTVAEASR